MKVFFTVLIYSYLFFCVVFNGFAQKGTQIGFGAGLHAYRGDLSPDPFGDVDLGYASGHIRYSVSPHLALKMRGKLGSYSANIEDAQIKAQELNYSTLDSFAVNGRSGDVSLSVEWFPFGMINELATWDLYVGIGIGWLYTSVKLFDSGNAASAVMENPQASSAFMPIVLGANFGRNTNPIHAHLYFGFDYTFTDFIDGVSDNFNPNDNDHFFLAGVTIGFNLVNSNINTY